MPLDKDGRLPVPRYLDEPDRPFPEMPFVHEVNAPQMLAIVPGVLVGLVVWRVMDAWLAVGAFTAVAFWFTRVWTGRPRPPLAVWLAYTRRQIGHLRRFLAARTHERRNRWHATRRAARATRRPSAPSRK